jgi:hypothetical protein
LRRLIDSIQNIPIRFAETDRGPEQKYRDFQNILHHTISLFLCGLGSVHKKAKKKNNAGNQVEPIGVDQKAYTVGYTSNQTHKRDLSIRH